MSETKEVKKDVVVETIATAIKADVKVEEGKFVFGEDTIEKALKAFNETQAEKKKEEISEAQLKAAQHFESDFEAAMVLAAGEAGLKEFKANSELAEISGKLSVGANKLEVSQKREHSVRNPGYNPEKEGSQERIQKNGNVFTKRSAYGDAQLDRALKQVLAMAGDYL